MRQVGRVEEDGQSAEERLRIRKEQSAPLVAALEAWLRDQRSRLSNSAAVSAPIDYMLRRWGRGDVGPVAHLGAPDLDWPNPSLDCALRSMAVPHDAVAAIRQLQILPSGNEGVGLRNQTGGRLQRTRRDARRDEAVRERHGAVIAAVPAAGQRSALEAVWHLNPPPARAGYGTAPTA